MGPLYLGIDPGKNGGAAVLDAQGDYVDAWRWREEEPLLSFNKLSIYVEGIVRTYLERVNLFRELSVDQILRMAPMVGNSAKWEMMCVILGLPVTKIMPRIWQSRIGLAGYKKTRQLFTNVKGKQLLLTPYNLAKHLWPDAPLKTQADDGMAVGLLLAEVARQDAARAAQGIDSGFDALSRRSRHDIATGNRKAFPRGKYRSQRVLTPSLFETRMDSKD